jgi:isopentenyldiphosphate isomerase
MRELTLDLTHQSFYFMRKIFYKQEAKEVEGFGEYEVDYVFVCKLATDTLDFTPVPEEIDQACWISQEKLPIFMKEEIEKGGAFSPWFSKMECNGLLHEWWQLASRNDLKDAPGENEKLVLSLS